MRRLFEQAVQPESNSAGRYLVDDISMKQQTPRSKPTTTSSSSKTLWKKDSTQPQNNVERIDTTSLVSSFLEHSHWQDLCGGSLERKQFLIHRQKEFSRIPLFLLFMLVILAVGLWTIRLLTAYPMTVLTRPIVSIYAITAVSLLVYVIIECSQPFLQSIGWNFSQQHIKDSHDNDKKSWDTILYSLFETLLFFFICACGQLYVIQLVYLREDRGYTASQISQTNGLPEGIAVLSLMLPIIVYVVFKGVRFRHVILANCILFAVDLYLMIHYKLRQSWLPIVFGFAFSMFVTSEYHRQCWHNFFITFRLQHALSENARMAEEIKGNELRHMIGNVAHDLKTPLSSFISGMEVIRLLASELRDELSPPSTAGEQEVTRSDSRDSDTNTVLGKLSTILEVAENVTNTNAFMIMTINRCIDYNRTLFGLKLTPKIETFQLKDCAEFTLKCLSNPQNKISIDCEYQGAALKGGVVLFRSDKQWLQENLLCLLGNAVKYSVPGSVVKVMLSVENNQALNDEKHSLKPAGEKGLLLDNPSEYSTTALLEEGLMSESVQSASSFSSNKRQRHSKKDHKIMLKVVVVDNGPGIVKEIRKKLFEEPAQAARINGGTGLGLYSLAKRVDALGGDYGIESRSDGQQGSQFWFTIPFEIVTDIDASQSALGTSSSNDLSTRGVVPVFSVSDGNSRQQQQLQVLNTADREIGKRKDDEKQKEKEKHDKDSGRVSVHQSIDAKCTIHAVIEDTTSASVRRKVTEETPGVNIALEPLPNRNQGNEKEKEIESGKKQLRVLVVDDSSAIVKMTSLALKKQGYQVSSAENGLVAVEKFKCTLDQANEELDIILMDFQMPVMDGVDAIKNIRLHEAESKRQVLSKFKSPLIIGFSAKSDETQIEAAYKNGMDGFLPKPFTINAFQSLLTVCMNSKSNHSGSYDDSTLI
jgi:signal transduction histidine kinase/FixJ family two-component response regulator